MKLVSFNESRIGIVDGDAVADVTDDALVGKMPSWPPVGMVQCIASLTASKPNLREIIASAPRLPITSVRLQCPILWPNKVIAFPANYHAHVEEMKAGTGLISAFKADGQGFFLKSNSSLSGPADPIILPAIPGREIHHECEIAIIIGAGGREIKRENALQHVFGYSCLLDIVVRGREERVMRKSFDTFCPLGPWIVTSDDVPDAHDMSMELHVNGELRQHANTKDLIVDIPAMISMASSVMTLYPGDIIASGTPAGVGPIKGGDRVTISVSHVGSMTIDVVQSQTGTHSVWNKEPPKGA